MTVQYTTAGISDVPAWMQAAGQQLSETVGGTYDTGGNLIPQTLADGSTTLGLMNDPYRTFSQANPSINRVANQDALQIAAYEGAGTGIGAYSPYMTGADTALDRAGQFNTAAQIDDGTGNMIANPNLGANAASALGTGVDTGIGTLSQFQNPYQTNVIDATMDEMNRQHNMDMNQLQAGAVQAGAFGGSRHGVAESESLRGHEANRTAALAKLNAEGFNTANKMNESYMNRSLQGGQMMGNLATNESQANLDAARVGSAIGGLAQQYGTNDINLQAHYGDRAQKYNQSVTDAAAKEHYERQAVPFQMAGFYSDILNGVPTSQSTMTQQTAPNPSALSQGIGALGTYASIGNQFGWWGDNKES